MPIIENIKILREKNEISQRELGRRIDKSGQFISLVEQGKSNPSIETLKKIANALNVPLEALTGDNYINRQNLAENIKELLNKQGTLEKDIPNLMNFLTEFINSSFFFKLFSLTTNEPNINKEKIISNELKGLTQDEFINLTRSIYDNISKIILDRKENPISDEKLCIKFIPKDN